MTGCLLSHTARTISRYGPVLELTYVPLRHGLENLFTCVVGGVRVHPGRDLFIRDVLVLQMIRVIVPIAYIERFGGQPALMAQSTKTTIVIVAIMKLLPEKTCSQRNRTSI